MRDPDPDIFAPYPDTICRIPNPRYMTEKQRENILARVFRDHLSKMKTRRTTRSFASNSRHVEEKTSKELLPLDLVVEILTKLPAKSIARFRCLSKVCASTLISPHFTDSFISISWSRPNLLITCQKDGETFFFSSPQPQNLSPVTSASFHMSFPINCSAEVSRPVCGLVCGLNQQTIKRTKVTVPLICNPSTGESLTLPKVKTRRKQVMSYLGYDPIDKQFKLLCMTKPFAKPGPPLSEEHQVLTLEPGKKLSWRMIKCDVPHWPDSLDYIHGDDRCIYDGICINGVFCYLADISWGQTGTFPDVVCFDVRYEKFSFIKKALQDTKINYGGNNATLVNYKGKLAKLQPSKANHNIYIGIDLWVLEDAQKHQWSSYIYLLPLPLRNIFEKTSLCFVGTTGTGEIVLSPKNISDSFYLLYYNPETNTTTRVEIQGMEAFKPHRAYIFLDHVENVKLIMASV